MPWIGKKEREKYKVHQTTKGWWMAECPHCELTASSPTQVVAVYEVKKHAEVYHNDR